MWPNKNLLKIKVHIQILAGIGHQAVQRTGGFAFLCFGWKKDSAPAQSRLNLQSCATVYRIRHGGISAAGIIQKDRKADIEYRLAWAFMLNGIFFQSDSRQSLVKF